jgi:hypothetical protein
MAPQLGRVLFDEVGAQEIPAFAQSCLPEFVAIEFSGALVADVFLRGQTAARCSVRADSVA